jgi:hypothetical protein
MRSLTETGIGRPIAGAAPTLDRVAGSLSFDWVMIALSTVFLGGLFLDGWAHNHGKVDQSFFTIWHAFFYTGFALVALLLAGTLLFNRTRGHVWAQALPDGYQLSLLGVIVFAAGGVGDLIWHELFGIEESFDALISPTHLMLGLGLALVITGPLRAAWRRSGRTPGWRELGPALLALAGLISVMSFFMMFSHPLMSNVGGARHQEYYSQVGQVAGVIGLLLMAALLVGPVLLAMRRWQLPPGSLVLVWGINSVAMALVDWHHGHTIYLLLAMLIGAMVADGLRFPLRANFANPGALHLFAFCVSVLIFGAYFVALLATEGSRWTVHMLAGSVVLPGVVSWLLSYLIFPPELPEAA